MKQYYIVEDGKPIGAFSAQELRYRHIEPMTLIWREGFKDWQTILLASNQYPELAPAIGEAEQTSAQSSDILLGKIGGWIDQLLTRNSERVETHFLYKRLNRWRGRHLAAAPSKQRATGFFISSAVLLIVGSLCFGSSWGWFLTKCWAMFIAATEFPYFYGIMKKLSDDVLRTSLYFIPYRVWNWITRFSGLVSAIGLAYLLGGVLTPIYAAYQLFRYSTASSAPQLVEGEQIPKTPSL